MQDKKTSIKIILFFIFVVITFLLLRNDFYIFIFWWLCLLVLGLVFLPITAKIFHKFHDRGYLFSKVIGIGLSSYLMWFLSSIKLLKFKAYSCIIVVLIFLIVNYIVFQKANAKSLIREKTSTYLNQEIIFFAILALAIYIRGFKPEAYGTEKFMDYGFMTSMMRADYMPPVDFWFAGEKLNYYYVGQFIATYLSKLSFVPVSHGYNLMLVTLAALSFVLTGSLVYNMTKNYFSTRNIKAKYSPILAGLLSGAGVSMAGNMHFSIFYYIIPNLQDMLGIERTNYWFSDSTRYIGYHPDTADKTIHEYPSYSFILGDLHAHVLNIIFVITLIAILYAWLLDSKRLKLTSFEDIKSSKNLREIIQPKILLIGFFIGLFHMTNFWDFPIYFVVTGGTIVFSLIRNYGFSKITLLLTSINAVIIILVEELVALPFTLSFDQISTNILATESYTPIYQLLILWGLPITLITGFIIYLVQSYKVIIKKHKVSFFNSLHLSDLFILILGLCAIGLVFIPELVYVEDIYSGDYKRANTMFKLTYQAFIMFGISFGYILVKFLKEKRFLWQKKFTIICLVLFISTLGYFPIAVKSWYGNITKVEDYKGMDASAFLKDTMTEDYYAIEWINDNITETSVILEANGDSYSDYERVSVFTGHSTVLGWYVHEWLWRGDTEIINERAADIETIYTSSDIEEVSSLIEKYKIDYIYVGKLEQDKYENINHDLIKTLGKVVYEEVSYAETTFITYIVDIN